MPERTRFTRYLLIPALLVLCATAGAQTVISSERPVADAIEKLESLYGWAITYEDTPYVFDGDIEAPTLLLRKVGEGPRDSPPRRRTFSFDLENVGRPAKGMRSPESSARAAILAMLKSYSDSVGGAEMFALTESDGLFHVVPVQRRDKSGNLEKVVPILDSSVTLPAQQRIGTQLLREVCQALTQEIGERVYLGQPFRRQTYVTPNPGETARSVLSRLLAEQARPLPVSWRLNYQPGYGYVLNIHAVDTSR